MMKVKLCRECGKPVERPDKRADCDECFNRIRRERYRDDKSYRDKMLKKNKKSFRTMRGKCRRMLVDARGRAKRMGLPFDLDIEDIVIPECCPYLGISLRLDNDGKCDSSPSLDKIVPELGYVKGNVEVISERANRIKNDSTPDELMLIANRLRGLIDGNK